MATDDQKRKQRHLEDISKTLTDEEKQLIQDSRSFKDIAPGKRGYNIALFNDVINREHLKHKSVIEKCLLQIEDMRNQKRRLQSQLMSGEITALLPNGQSTMNADEVKQQINYIDWLIKAEVMAIPMALLAIRRIVGHKNIAMQVVVSEDEFEAYAEGVEKRLTELGFAVPY